MECAHPALFAGLCVICGQDVEQAEDFLRSEKKDDTLRTTTTLNVSGRALGGRHDALLRVALSQAKAVASDHFARLIHGGKLALVLDLDHTLVHSIDAYATDVEATLSPPPHHSPSPYCRAVPSSPDMHMLSEGRTLTVVRPGTQQFLERMSAKFEIHLYTMGQKDYAVEVARLLDPRDRLFSSVVTRDDFNVPGQKNLDVLMIDPRVCVILDDFVDVWHEENRDCVIRVNPFFAFYKVPQDIKTSGGVPGKYYYRKHLAETFTDLCNTIPLRLERAHTLFYQSFGRRACDVRKIVNAPPPIAQQEEEERRTPQPSSSSSSLSSSFGTETEEES